MGTDTYNNNEMTPSMEEKEITMSTTALHNDSKQTEEEQEQEKQHHSSISCMESTLDTSTNSKEELTTMNDDNNNNNNNKENEEEMQGFSTPAKKMVATIPEKNTIGSSETPIDNQLSTLDEEEDNDEDKELEEEVMNNFSPNSSVSNVSDLGETREERLDDDEEEMEEEEEEEEGKEVVEENDSSLLADIDEQVHYKALDNLTELVGMTLSLFNQLPKTKKTEKLQLSYKQTLEKACEDLKTAGFSKEESQIQSKEDISKQLIFLASKS